MFLLRSLQIWGRLRHCTPDGIERAGTAGEELGSRNGFLVLRVAFLRNEVNRGLRTGHIDIFVLNSGCELFALLRSQAVTERPDEKMFDIIIRFRTSLGAVM